MANQAMLLSQATALLDEVYDMDIIPQQVRFGKTAALFTKTTPWKGGAMHKKFINQIFTRTRMSTDLEADAPDAGRINLQDVKIEESNLRDLAFTIQYSIPTGKEVDGGVDAAYNIASRLAAESQEAIGEARNMAIHSNTNGQMALVADTYNTTGAIYPNGSATTCFIKIDNGSIAAFQAGQLIDIHSGSTATVRIVATVNDVCKDSLYIGGYSVGPGITATYEPTESGGAYAADAHFDNVADNDMITLHDWAASCNYDMAFQTLCNRTTPGAYFSVSNRASLGYQYLIPYGRNYSSVALDVDLHFGNFADVMGLLYNKSRLYRVSQGFALSESICCVAPPNIVNEVVRQVGASNSRFTKVMASSLSEAQRQKLFGVRGYDGVLLRFPDENIPTLEFVTEPLAKPNTIRIVDPNAFEWIRFGSGKPTYIPNGNGGIWHNRRNVTTGNLTKTLEASGSVQECLFCDQPQVGVYSIEDVTSSL